MGMRQSFAAWWLLSVLLSTSVWVSAQESQQPLGNVAASNNSLLWGPYRPNLYFGMRPRLPSSLLTGLIWGNMENPQTIQNNFRHTCEQSDQMAGYGWEEYDTHLGGREVIHDTGNKVDLTIDYIKVPGGHHGGSWGVRISGKKREDAHDNIVTSVLFYASMEGLGMVNFNMQPSPKPYEGLVTLHGQSVDLGEFDIDITEGKGRHPYKTHESWDEKPLDGTLAASFAIPAEHMWRSKDIMFASMKKTIDDLSQRFGQENMPPPWQAFTIVQDVKPGNVHMIQKVFIGDFTFDVLFKSRSAPEQITSDTLDEAIPATSKAFKTKFGEVFKAQAPFTKPQHRACAQSMFSNLLGGIGYFYGDSVVDRSGASEYDEENEGFWEETEAARARNQFTQDSAKELFTSVPSRAFFPRGFLWDEGFHLVPIVEWDPSLAMDIVESWFNLIDDDGWIAREQILGGEARSKVPPEFQVQYPHYANPPTLFLIVDTLVAKINAGKLPTQEAALLKSRLQNLYPLLTRHYKWLRRSQAGDIKSYDRVASSSREAYRWRGRTPRHILTSGLDDYPRPQPPHPGELHLDLISWVGMVAHSLTDLATLIGETDDISTFSSQFKAIQKNVDDLHWSSSQKTYCDASIDDYDEHTLVCHKGYISLFPFMTGLLLSDHAHVPDILNLISDPEQLWSEYGVRSLSKSDEFYGTDENYWRSPIWINMNYLILNALFRIATDATTPKATKQQATQIYSDLRKNLVENVVKQWQETGFAWEQYNPETGAGQRTQHFTGWTSLVVPIMGMPDLTAGGDFKHEEL